MRRFSASFKASMITAALLVSASASAEHTRVTNPSAISLEALGRGLMYSVNFDRVVSDELAGGIGVGTFATETLDGADSDVTSTAIPIYLNYYVTRDAGSLYLTGGLTVLTQGSSLQGLKTSVGDVELPDSSILPTVGIGYENRGDFGFLLRVTAYGMVAEKFAPWVGFNFGYAF